MEQANHFNVDNIVADNTNLTTADIPVPPGSDIRLMMAISAITAAPAGTIFLEGKTDGGDYVVLATRAAAAVGTGTDYVENCPRIIRYRRTQAGGANNLTMSVDLIIRPPNTGN